MLRRAFLFTAAAFCACSACLGYAVRDARGVEFEFSGPPRAATIVPAITQNIFAAGAGKYLVANSRYCDYPEEAKGKIKLGGYIDPDYEKILSVKPEIFLLPTTADSRVERRLSKLGIKCFVLNGEGLENISADLRLLGRLFGTSETAEKVADSFDMLLKSGSPAGRGRRAMFMFDKMAAGKGSFAGGLLAACGLENCADKTGRPWAEVGREFVLAARPEILFVECGGEDSRAGLEKFYKTDPVWRTTPAVKNGMLCFVPSSSVLVPSVRLAEALRIMRAFCAATAEK